MGRNRVKKEEKEKRKEENARKLAEEVKLELHLNSQLLPVLVAISSRIATVQLILFDYLLFLLLELAQLTAPKTREEVHPDLDRLKKQRKKKK